MIGGSLFSGIGGLELGLEMAGAVDRWAWQAECDPAALAVLAHHWPEVHRYTDVRDVNESSARVDVVCGGFPCQPHSLAGRRRGTADARWLWPEFYRVVKALRPSCVFIENVPGLRTSGLSVVLADLASLGLDAEWDCFRASDVGAPHTRERLFVLAHAHAQPGAPWVGRQTEHDRTGSVSRINDSQRPGVWVVPTPEACRGADGHAGRMDVALLGNAVVPQQAALAWRTLTARAAAALEAA